MSEKIVSNDEIKLIAGIGGSDARIEIFNRVMTANLADALSLKQFGRFEVQNELVKILNNSYFSLRSFPVVANSLTLYRGRFQKDEVQNILYQADDYDFRKFHLANPDGSQAYFAHCDYYASYTAGFLLNAELEVVDNDVVGITLSATINGVTTPYTFIASGVPEDNEILKGVDADATMNNIATKLGGVGVDGKVQLPLGMTLASSEVSNFKIEFENPDEVLDELKLAVAYMVAGAISDKSQIEGVSSYRMGTKQVTFRDTAERDFTSQIIDKYIAKFKPFYLFAS